MIPMEQQKIVRKLVRKVKVEYSDQSDPYRFGMAVGITHALYEIYGSDEIGPYEAEFSPEAIQKALDSLKKNPPRARIDFDGLLADHPELGTVTIPSE